MNLEAVREMAVRERLYPSVILHGADEAARRAAALDLARLLLCARPGDDPEAVCPHCRRLGWPGDGDAFHPDFQVLERDLKTATSVEATRHFLRGAQVAPFEARGQVFVVAAAESLSGEASNALLKSLEEPHLTAPRHFFLLAPSQFDLLPTLRSRSLAVYLGGAGDADEARIEELALRLAVALAEYRASGSAADLFAAAAVLGEAGGWDDPRAGRPWSLAAAAVRRAADAPDTGPGRPLLALAEALLAAPQLRLRGISAPRILEGLVFRHLAARAAVS
ncbi:MAG: hypothetical protein OES32_08015 [Acidobacteriota bacterium]|nr:hypothetical protein [Acidobacteriota bacterium]MDH3523519.1 hypothetical protein [Acidobacteriota bacterium]